MYNLINNQPNTPIANGENVTADVANRQHIPTNDFISTYGSMNVKYILSSGTIIENEDVIVFVDAQSDGTINLPPAVNQKAGIYIKRTDNNLSPTTTIQADGSDKIEEVTGFGENSTVKLENRQDSLMLYPEGNKWKIIDFKRKIVFGQIELLNSHQLTNTFTKIKLDQTHEGGEYFNTDINSSDFGFKAPTSGIYQVNGVLGIQPSNSHVEINLVSSSGVKRMLVSFKASSTSGWHHAKNFTTHVRMNKGDIYYLEGIAEDADTNIWGDDFRNDVSFKLCEY